MKYTVVIRQPIAEEVRPELEKQLVERFGLGEQQAQKLAERRAGRLLKPTSQARANLLLKVYQSVGAQVIMEEVPEEGEGTETLPKEPVPVGKTTVLSAPGADPFAPDPFAATPAIIPAPTAITGGAKLGSADESLLSWTRRSTTEPSPAPGAVTGHTVISAAPQATEHLSEESPLHLSESASLKEMTIVQELAQAPLAETSPKPADDWADFAGGLNLPETAAPATPAPKAIPSNNEFLNAVATATAEPEVGSALNLPRNSLINQIRLGTLIPLLLSSLLTLLVLAFVLPASQNRALSQNARNLAATVAANIGGNQSASTAQLDNIIKNTNMGFVRVSTPDGKAYVRSKNAQANEKINKQLGDWLEKHPNGGNLNVEGQNYIASRVYVVQDGGQTRITNADNAKTGTLVRRVTVGLPTSENRGSLLLTLGLTLLSGLLGLGIASALATRSAQRVAQPIADLVKVADAISLGDLSRPVQVNSNDEIGDLAQALERMRLSLEAAMERLRRRKRG